MQSLCQTCSEIGIARGGSMIRLKPGAHKHHNDHYGDTIMEGLKP
jgi:hypothetical protein